MATLASHNQHKKKVKLFAISGSTRKNSSNHSLLKAIAALFPETIEVILFEGLSNLPHFNPDNDGADIVLAVKDFRQQIKDADAIIICTPEYAHGVPGSLKNAIDWTVSSGEFSGKPTILITASTDGRFGHNALLEILQVIEAKNISQFQLLIPFIKTKIGHGNKIMDEKTLEDIRELMNRFINSL